MPFLTFIACLVIRSQIPTTVPQVQVATFTDAKIDGALMLRPVRPSKDVPGTLGQGIDATRPVTLNGLKLNQVEGMIGVWIKPSWDGNDGKKHKLWLTNMEDDRQLSLTKSEGGLLRAAIQTPDGWTVSRADIKNWKAGDWHHVVVGWTSHNGHNVGLPLWVDRVAVDGQITTHGVFTPGKTPHLLELSDATFDELIVRSDPNAEGPYGMVACVYRDYFRTAPYPSIRLEHEATHVSSDTRLVAGFTKQLGLSARLGHEWQPLVENVVRYNQWGYFDARRLIQWSTSDPRIATIDSSGKLTAIRPGTCTFSAKFHGLVAQSDFHVISPDLPDLDLIGIELTPRFRTDEVHNRLDPGELVVAKVRVGNFGSQSVPAGATIRFSLSLRTNHNFLTPPLNQKPYLSFNTKLSALKPGEETWVEFKWPYPAQSSWMRAEVDPEHKVPDLCLANNAVEELTDARPIHMGFNPKFSQAEFKQKQLNHVGSFSYYDWVRAEKLRMDVILHEAVSPTTGPDGVEEAYRIDKFTALEGGKWDEEPFNKEADLYDGGYPVNEKVDLSAIDCAIIHELGHTVLSQPDIYGYVMSAKNVFITDDQGNPVSGTPDLPIVSGDSNLPSSPGVNIPCGVGYPSLMDGCQLWLAPSMAGHIMYYRGYRQDRFWGSQGRLIPTHKNQLLFTDAYDNPLKNAAVYIYHVSQAPVQDSGAKYFSDRPKFVGQTDEAGRYVFPTETDQFWDDPKTDVVDSYKPVWNPFGTATKDTAFTPNVWEVEGLLLIRIVSGKHSEYRFMDLTQFNTEFLSGNKVQGTYLVQTSLEPSDKPTPIVRRSIPDAIMTVNKAPVAVAPKEISVTCGSEFSIDGSKSYDPEGQPLIYRWNVGEGWLKGSLSQSAKLTLTAPNKPIELSYKFWVIDGIRCSQAVEVKVHVVRG